MICVKAFSSLIRKEERNDLINGVCFGRDKVAVTHLFFADDSLVFLEADRNQCCTFKNILESYYVVSRQVINFYKSDICFGKAMDADVKKELSCLLQVNMVNMDDK